MFKRKQKPQKIQRPQANSHGNNEEVEDLSASISPKSVVIHSIKRQAERGYDSAARSEHVAVHNLSERQPLKDQTKELTSFGLKGDVLLQLNLGVDPDHESFAAAEVWIVKPKESRYQLLAINAQALIGAKQGVVKAESMQDFLNRFAEPIEIDEQGIGGIQLGRVAESSVQDSVSTLGMDQFTMNPSMVSSRHLALAVTTNPDVGVEEIRNVYIEDTSLNGSEVVYNSLS